MLNKQAKAEIAFKRSYEIIQVQALIVIGRESGFVHYRQCRDTYSYCCCQQLCHLEHRGRTECLLHVSGFYVYKWN